MKNKLLILAVLVIASIQGQAQLTVTSGNPVNAIVDSLVGTGVTVSNITYTGNASARGLFSCAGGCNLGIAKGIFLSTGNAGQTPTSPPNDFHSTDLGASGDAQLNMIVNPQLTQDATILEFDFTPAADSIGFRFVFGSEEYNEFVNAGFNDVFAFYISGPGITGSKNLALIPSTTIPVSIDNVNNGNSGGVATGPCTNCAYYTDNVANGGGAIFFDGFTHVINAGTAVQPCQTYHMKFAIADVGDGVYDSGVFLEAKSFTSIGHLNLYVNGVPSTSDTIYACHGDSVILSASGTSSNITWNNGATTQTIVVTEANITTTGVYQYAVINGAALCFASSKQVKIIFVTPTATITPIGSTNLCPGGSVDLQANAGNSYLWSTGATTQTITVSTAGTYTVTVYVTPTCFATSSPVAVTVAAPTAAISGVTTICSGQATTLTANTGNSYIWSNGATTQSITVNSATTYTVTVTYPGGCTASASVAVTTNTNPTPSITGNNSICQGQSSTLSAGSYTSYLWSTGSTGANISANTSGIYTVTVTDANGCTGSTTFNLTVNSNPTPAITGTTAFCQGGNSTLSAGGGYTNYLWSTGAVTPTLNVTTGGTYSVTVTSAAGCTGTTNTVVTVNPNPSPSISGTTAFCTGASTTLNVGGTYPQYQWSTGSSANSITVTTANTFSVTVTDANGCTGTTSATTTVNPLPTPSITGNNSICQGQSSTLSAGSYTSYLWSTGSTGANISANTSGIYTVTVTDANGCTGSTTFNLTVNPNPTPAITGTTAFCQGGNSTLSAGGGYTNYLWSTGAATPTLNVTTGGTYSVTVTNAAGCTATTNTVVTVNPNPTPSISGTTAFCTGASTTLNVGGTYPQYQWSTGSSANSITITTANTFSVTVTDANGCTGTTSATTTINPLPTPSITGNNSICQGQSSILSAGSYTSYLWSTGSTSANISANTSGVYSVTVTDANGCTGSTTFNLIVNPNPTPAITGTTAFCQGANSTLSAGGGYTNYLWSTGAVTPTLNVTTGGTYNVTVTNGYGCSASASLPITVYSLPAPVINGPAGICPGASAALATGSFATYVWSTGSNSQTINTTVPGTYAVTVTDANGCVDSVSYTLAAYTNPAPVITGTAAICQNQSSLLDAGSFASYNWSTGASTQTISVTQSGTYSVTVTNSTGCSATASFAVLVNPLPSPAITGINAFCSGDSSQLTVSGNYPSYLWSTGASSSAVTVNAGGTYVVTVTDANGCTASASQSITVWNLPSPVIAGDNNICIGESATLTTGNYASYQWSTGASTDSITTTTAGNYVVTVTDMNGCVNTSAPFNIAVHQLPSAMVSGTTAICIGQSTPLQIDITGTPPFRYGYTDGSTAFGPFTTSNSTVTIPVAPTSATTYTLNLITDLYCNGNFNGSAAITVNPLPQPVITGPSAICENETAMLNAGAFAAYQWSTGENTAFINANTNGNYTCTVTSTEGCDNSANFYLTVNPLPVVSFTNDSSLTCEIPRIHFTNTSVYPAGSVFNWNFGDTFSSEMNPVNQYDSSGTYPVTLIITTPAGCVDSVTQNVEITIFPLPLAQFDVSPDFAPLYNSTIELIDNSENAVIWHWDFGDGQKTDIPVSQYQYQSPGKYTITLQVTNIAGCESVTSREVFITPFFVPNAFTPNGDGKNETFYDPGYVFDVSSVTMRIWNRWGQMVFSSDNMSHVWDGKDVSGNDAPQGVYYYTLKVVQNSGHENDYAGSVTLVR